MTTDRRPNPVRRHQLDRAGAFGQHTLVARHIDAEPDASIWQCLACGGTILGYELEDNLWQMKLGATCPEFSMLLAIHKENTDDNHRDDLDVWIDVELDCRTIDRSDQGVGNRSSESTQQADRGEGGSARHVERRDQAAASGVRGSAARRFRAHPSDTEVLIHRLVLIGTHLLAFLSGLWFMA